MTPAYTQKCVCCVVHLATLPYSEYISLSLASLQYNVYSWQIIFRYIHINVPLDDEFSLANRKDTKHYINEICNNTGGPEHVSDESRIKITTKRVILRGQMMI